MYQSYILSRINQREENQDKGAVLTLKQSDGGYFLIAVLADGMGGLANGQLAASTVVDQVLSTLYHQLRMLPSADSEQISRLMRESLIIANDAVREIARAEGDYMGSTVVLAVIDQQRSCYTVNVGDSIVCLYSRESGLKNLSRKHNQAYQLYETGQFTERESLTRYESARLYNFMGASQMYVPEIAVHPLSSHDYLFMFSDGAIGFQTMAELQSIIGDNQWHLARVGELIMDQAVEQGETDNQTMITIIPGG